MTQANECVKREALQGATIHRIMSLTCCQDLSGERNNRYSSINFTHGFISLFEALRISNKILSQLSVVGHAPVSISGWIEWLPHGDRTSSCA